MRGILIAAAVLAALWLLTNAVKPTKNWNPVIFIGLSAAAGIVLRLGGA